MAHKTLNSWLANPSITDMTETHIFKILSVMLLFLLINFNRNLGMIYVAMLFADWFFFKDEKRLLFPTNKVKNTVFAILIAVVVYFAFLIVASIVVTATKQVLSLQAIFDAMASTSPILEGDPYITLISFGILIPIIETRFFFGRLFEYLGKLKWFNIDFNAPLRKQLVTYKVWFLIFLIACLFTFFHITAKCQTSSCVEDTPALMVTLVFAMFSMWLVLGMRELESAIELHIMANSLSILRSMSVFDLGSVLGL